MNYEESLNNPESIAVIGMVGRFPGAKNLNEFWHNLRDGVESISVFTDAELLASGIAFELLQDPNYVKARGILEDIELFDASFFGFNPKEAEITDPQHRLFLECAWSALENAGYNSEIYPGRIGVYAGLSLSGYLFNNLAANRDLIESIGTYQTLLSNDRDFLTTQTSYKLNLTGPSVVIQTACSTSLVAIHFACQSLIAGESDMALAGGVSISVPHYVGYSYQPGGIFAPDGHCRAFDAKAEGTVGGNGIGIVVLKRLEDALADRDCIHAVIRGSAINNDGAVKVGYTAPSMEGQTEAIAQAQAVAEVEAETITYIETHGTGTVMGDPIEIEALKGAFRASTQKNGFCAIGSVKTNIGHLDVAAGVAGIIKTILALKHKLIPPSLNFEQPNPQIDFANSPFYVNTSLSPWKTNSTPRRAGVSSFGIGGTNAHVILEEAPVLEVSSPSRSWQLLLLSAKTATALEIATTNLLQHLKSHPDLNLSDIAYTLQVGRRDFNYRRLLIVQDVSDAVTALEASDSPQVLTFHQEHRNPPVVFMFPGQGSQYVNMARELYQVEPTFQGAVDLCCELFTPHLGLDLRNVLYPTEEQAETATPQLNQTAIAQSALFAIEYALAKLWRSWGVHPQAMIGHSIGEYVAAHLAGVFSLEEAVALVAARGQLMQQLPSGSMLAVSLEVEEVQPLLGDQLFIAAINAPSLCVVSGCSDAIAQLEAHLVAKGVKSRHLHTSHAFHSEMMDPILQPFIEQMKKVNLKSPKIPYISNVTGTWITTEQATDPNYWAKHLRSSVHFLKGIQLFLKESKQILLEVGPGRTLTTFVKQSLEKADSQFVLTTLTHPLNQESDVKLLLTSLGRLWLAGIHVNWSSFYQYERRSRLALPTYPFERQRYWIEPQKQVDTFKIHPQSLDKKPDLADWFYISCWKQFMPPQAFNKVEIAKQKSCWLLFINDCNLSVQMVKQLEQENQDVITVRVGEQFNKLSNNTYIFNPRQRNDYSVFFKEMRTLGKIPKTIVHLWCVTLNQLTPHETQDLGFYSLLFLAQALGEYNFTDPLQIGVISNNMQQVTGLETLDPEKATLIGPCKVIPQEYPQITCHSIDIIIPESKKQEEKLVEHILSELVLEPANSVTAYRGNRRWVQTFEPMQLPASVSNLPPLRPFGVYLVTGGLGGVGGVLAEYLAQTVQAKLILIGRSIPAREEWEQLLKNEWGQDKVKRQIQKVQALEALGAEVLVKNADVADLEQMQAVINQACERFGKIHGVIHAAGIAGGGVIQLKTPELAASVLSPKVTGARVLDSIFQNQQLDFFVLCSSLNSLLGGLGQVDYCAANAFLDAIANSKSAKDGTFAVSINWDTWLEVGMAVDTAVPIALKQRREENLKKGMSSQQGKDVFHRILCQTLPQFIVSTQDLQPRLEQSQTVTASTTLQELVQPSLSKSKHPRPNLQNVYVAPQNQTEQIVADVWQELLGFEQIGSYDNFFELGGHSLLAIQIISQLRQAFQVEIPLNNLFVAPTVTDLARAIAQQQPQLTTEENYVILLPQIILNTTQRYQPFPLTDVQQAYWIGRSGAFELGNVATHGYQEIESVGLDLERLTRALQRLIERHEMLRTVVLPDGQQQILQSVPNYQIEVLDLRGQNPEAMRSQLADVRQQMSHQVLASDQWPLFELRATLLDAQRVRLHISIDALIVDNWSMEILQRELFQLYQNPQALLAPLEISFRDYVLAEISLKNSEFYERSRDYWFSRLSTLPSAPELPLMKNPSSITQPYFVRRSADLQPTTWLKLKNRALQAGLTPSGVLLAAFADILTVWSQNPRFTLNLTLFNRLPLHPQVNELIGDFTSLTLLAVDNSMKESFAIRARRLQKQLWEDLEHSYFSGIQVLRELARTQGGATRAAMPIVFTSTLTQGTSNQDTLESVKLGEVVYSISQTSQVWLDHQVYEEREALVFVWDAVEELFPEGLLDDMFSAYCRLLNSLATEEEVWETTTRQVINLTHIEQQVAIKASEPIFPGMLHTLFAAQVPQRLHQPAVVTESNTLTYEELHCRANQIAHRLRQLGACPNQVVAVVMNKGWEQVVAVLGILTAGAAYLPIDPDLPQERCWYLLEQGEVQIVLTQTAINTGLKWQESVQRICVDTVELENEYNQSLESVQTPEDLAYVIYTSGSTGKPKGVMINHRGAVNTILDVNQRFSVGANDRVLALSSLSFDLSVYDIFGTLAAGGTIIIPETTTIKDPAHWLDLIRLLRVTIWNSVPVLMQMLVEYVAERPNELPNTTLRLILLSGDWLPLSLPKQIKALWEDLQVVSLGGATEASIWSIFYPIAAVDPTWKSIPYGQPLTNQRFYVLNELLKPCPVWVPGKLYIGGTGLAQGYWRDEEKTAASFIIHPQTQERLYKTGDLGRYLPDGNIEFLGREDFQVKVNGYRIELGEIEATLQQHPAVKEVVVSTVGESQENQQLVAYIVPKQELVPTTQHLNEAYEPLQLEGVLIDPVERIEFKLQQPGLQQLQLNQSTIQLPKPEFNEVLTRAYLQRQSYRQFLNESISLEKFSQFLSCLLQIKLDDSPLPKYRYASAGSLYPVQTYLYIKPNRVEGLKSGIYYYQPADHRLILISAASEMKSNVYGGNQSIFEKSAFSVFLIGQMRAISPMYGELAKDFCLLEAGYISQLLMQVAPEQEIGLCPIGSLEFEDLRDLFRLESSQVLLHSFVGGGINSDWTKHLLPLQTTPKPNSIAEKLRKFLQHKLPAYMVPYAYVLLNVLPLTPNGKVDRKALPVPDLTRNDIKESFVAPRTSTEEILATIFAEILDLGEIGIHDNFFELGGNSLQATRVITRLREAFQMDLSLRSLFEKPTVAGLANCIEAFRITAPELQSIADMTLSDREQGKL